MGLCVQALLCGQRNTQPQDAVVPRTLVAMPSTPLTLPCTHLDVNHPIHVHMYTLPCQIYCHEAHRLASFCARTSPSTSSSAAASSSSAMAGGVAWPMLGPPSWPHT
jgi:hypothetical protein